MNRLLVLIGAALLSFTQINAQTAESILSKVSEKIKASTGITANFTYTSVDRNNKSQGTVNGIMSLKGNKYYIKQGSNEIFFDGGSVWNFNGSDEVQISSPLKDASAITPQRLVNGDFAKGFTSKLVSSAGNTYNIELAPADKRQSFSKINLFISKTTHMITAANVVDKNGNTTRFTLSNIKTNVSIPDSKFKFDIRKYPGIEVIG